MRNPFDKILNWYFTKNSLPYWCIFLIDCAIVMASGACAFWIFNKTEVLLSNFFQVLHTMVIFTLLSVVGFRLFHTYSGFMRYSSFVDLMRIVYGNLKATSDNRRYMASPETGRIHYIQYMYFQPSRG